MVVVGSCNTQRPYLKVVAAGAPGLLGAEELAQGVAGVLEPVDDRRVGVEDDGLQRLHVHLALLVDVGHHLAVRREDDLRLVRKVDLSMWSKKK